MTRYDEIAAHVREQQAAQKLREQTQDAPLFAGVTPEPPPPANDAPTSRQAAAKVAQGAAAKLRREIFDLLTLKGPLTREEISKATGQGGDTVRPRLWELEGAGVIARTGETRRNDAGNPMETYRAQVVTYPDPFPIRRKS